MDTIIESKKRLTNNQLYLLGIAAMLAGLLFFLLLRDGSSTVKVEKEKLVIASVKQGWFNDYICVVGQVVPCHIIYLDAVEGGRVEAILTDEGVSIAAGQAILRLSNPMLNIGVMQSEANLAYQENELRNTRINMEREHLQLKQEKITLESNLNKRQRRYQQYDHLFQKQLIALEDYTSAKEELQTVRQQLELLNIRIKNDSLFRISQLASLEGNIRNMKGSLHLVRQRLENLMIKAPIAGQVGILNAKIGQSIAQGERIGQIITPDLKIQAQVDEHYIGRVAPSLQGTFPFGGSQHNAVVSKVYPEVLKGVFQVDFTFENKSIMSLKAGQTLHIDLQMGNPTKSLIIPRGSFFQSSGGEYIYVLDKNGKGARKQPLKIGRQNPQYYEVIGGLKAGDQVIISGYENFGDNERLIF